MKTLLSALVILSLLWGCAAPQATVPPPKLKPAVSELDPALAATIEPCSAVSDITLRTGETRGIRTLMFVIDTSGSMRSRASNTLLPEIGASISRIIMQYPELKTLLFFDASGANMATVKGVDIEGREVFSPAPFLNGAKSPADVKALIESGAFETLLDAYPFNSESTPAPGLMRAIKFIPNEDGLAHLYVIGDEDTLHPESPRFEALTIALSNHAGLFKVSTVEMNSMPDPRDFLNRPRSHHHFRESMTEISQKTGGRYFQLSVVNQ